MSGWLLRALVPLEHRDAIIGDLLEEQSSIERLEGRWRARRWLWLQLARSLPYLLVLRLRRGGPMRPYRHALAALILLVGLLQAWDSRLLGGPPLAIALVAAGLAVFTLTPLLAMTLRSAALPLALATGCVLAGRVLHGRSDLVVIAVPGVALTLMLLGASERRRAEPA